MGWSFSFSKRNQHDFILPSDIGIDISEFNLFTKRYVSTPGWSNQYVTLSNSYIVLLGQTHGKCLKASSTPYEVNGALSTQDL
jgi:hypothetical protein